MDSEAIVFDMEGVFLEGGSTPDRFYRQAAEELLGDETVERLSDEEYMTLMWFDDEAEYRRLCAREGLDPEEFWRNKEDRVEELEIRGIKEGQRELVEGAREVFESLHENYGLGVVSNNTAGVVEFAVESNGLDEFFDCYTGLENSVHGFNHRKPDAHYIEIVLNDLDADSGYYIGDRATDVEAAHRAGLEAIYVGEEALDSAEYSIRNIRELKEVVN